MNRSPRKLSIFFRSLSAFQAFVLTIFLVIPHQVVQAQTFNVVNLPAPGSMVNISEKFTPALLRGITLHPENPLLFDFIVDPGYSNLKDEQLRSEGERLIKYFLAALTVPEKDLWVNLSPYEKDRIIPAAFGQTEMGRDLLAQDYILKQISASLIYPEEDLGKDFWGKVYQKAKEIYGTDQIPVSTFNKVWIVPQDAVIVETEKSAFVARANLKVMLEEDLMAINSDRIGDILGNRNFKSNDLKKFNNISSSVVRDIILPQIQKEINEGKNFAQLRQVYYSLVLATWFKKNLKENLLNQIYSDQQMIAGVDIKDKQDKEKIYERYMEAYKKGVFNYIRKDVDVDSQKLIPRKYFSGGANLSEVPVRNINAKDVPQRTSEGVLTQRDIGPNNPQAPFMNFGSQLKPEVRTVASSDRGISRDNQMLPNLNEDSQDFETQLRNVEQQIGSQPEQLTPEVAKGIQEIRLNPKSFSPQTVQAANRIVASLPEEVAKNNGIDSAVQNQARVNVEQQLNQPETRQQAASSLLSSGRYQDRENEFRGILNQSARSMSSRDVRKWADTLPNASRLTTNSVGDQVVAISNYSDRQSVVPIQDALNSLATKIPESTRFQLRGVIVASEITRPVILTSTVKEEGKDKRASTLLLPDQLNSNMLTKAPQEFDDRLKLEQAMPELAKTSYTQPNRQPVTLALTTIFTGTTVLPTNLNGAERDVTQTALTQLASNRKLSKEDFKAIKKVEVAPKDAELKTPIIVNDDTLVLPQPMLGKPESFSTVKPDRVTSEEFLGNIRKQQDSFQTFDQSERMFTRLSYSQQRDVLKGANLETPAGARIIVQAATNPELAKNIEPSVLKSAIVKTQSDLKSPSPEAAVRAAIVLNDLQRSNPSLSAPIDRVAVNEVLQRNLTGFRSSIDSAMLSKKEQREAFKFVAAQLSLARPNVATTRSGSAIQDNRVYDQFAQTVLSNQDIPEMKEHLAQAHFHVTASADSKVFSPQMRAVSIKETQQIMNDTSREPQERIQAALALQQGKINTPEVLGVLASSARMMAPQQPTPYIANYTKETTTFDANRPISVDTGAFEIQVVESTLGKINAQSPDLQKSINHVIVAPENWQLPHETVLTDGGTLWVSHQAIKSPERITQAPQYMTNEQLTSKVQQKPVLSKYEAIIPQLDLNQQQVILNQNIKPILDNPNAAKSEEGKVAARIITSMPAQVVKTAGINPQKYVEQTMSQLDDSNTDVQFKAAQALQMSNNVTTPDVNTKVGNIFAERSKEIETKGGIDFNPAGINMQIQKKNGGINIKFDAKLIEQIRSKGIEGFVPVILNVQPINGALPLLSENTHKEERVVLSRL